MSGDWVSRWSVGLGGGSSFLWLFCWGSVRIVLGGLLVRRLRNRRVGGGRFSFVGGGVIGFAQLSCNSLGSVGFSPFMFVLESGFPRCAS